jgi:Sec7-like guanine-nucleotide exchange factor
MLCPKNGSLQPGVISLLEARTLTNLIISDVQNGESINSYLPAAPRLLKLTLHSTPPEAILIIEAATNLKELITDDMDMDMCGVIMAMKKLEYLYYEYPGTELAYDFKVKIQTLSYMVEKMKSLKRNAILMNVYLSKRGNSPDDYDHEAPSRDYLEEDLKYAIKIWTLSCKMHKVDWVIGAA